MAGSLSAPSARQDRSWQEAEFAGRLHLRTREVVPLARLSPGLCLERKGLRDLHPALAPPLRGQPFQAGCRVFACLGLAPEQLVGLGQHQRVRAAELPDLMLDWQLAGADLVLDVLAAGLGERPLQRALAADGEEPAECAAQFAAAAAGPGDRPVALGPGPGV